MTAEQRNEEIHIIIQAAVAAGGGNWKRGFRDQVEAICQVYREYQEQTPQQSNVQTAG